MPYFFIIPIYGLIFVGLLIISLGLRFIKQLRPFSSYVACGALGTFPGLIIGNVIFWLIAWGLFTLLQKPMQQVTSDIANGVEAIAVVIFFVGGLAIANIGGCVVGFWGGVLIRSRFTRKRVETCVPAPPPVSGLDR